MCETETDPASLADSHPHLSQLFDAPKEIVLRVFDLKEHETRAYLALLRYPDSSPDELSEVLDRHRRHVARSLRGLHEADLVKRERESFETGGVGYRYDPVPINEAQQYLQNQLDEWADSLQAEVEHFGETIQADTEIEIIESTEEPECSRGEGD